MRPIFLIGYMGSGKTTLGRELSRSMKLEFIDLDIFIENRFHTTVRNFFKSRGEAAFREIERSVLHETAEFQDVVIACGGGTPCYFDNMDFMKTKGVSVYLKVSKECIFQRLTIPTAKAKRPLIAGKTDGELMKFIEDALAKREPYYSRADIIFNAEQLDSEAEVNDSMQRLKEIIL